MGEMNNGHRQSLAGSKQCRPYWGLGPHKSVSAKGSRDPSSERSTSNGAPFE